MNDIKKFKTRNKNMIKKMAQDIPLQNLSKKWIFNSINHEYSYHFNWLGVPVIQYPQDLMAMQEIIWQTKPDIIIETGVARGGSLIFYASILNMIQKSGLVIGIDIDIRNHNKIIIKTHHLSKKIKLIEGSSTDMNTIDKVKKIIKQKKKILVILDSNHTHDHVLQELLLYSPFVKKNGYMVVFDSIIEDMPSKLVKNRPWKKGNNPKTAVHEFLKKNSRFQIDKEIENKLLITVAPDGYLKCIKD
jgi:cephalosporin hydroxylase